MAQPDVRTAGQSLQKVQKRKRNRADLFSVVRKKRQETPEVPDSMKMGI